MYVSQLFIYPVKSCAGVEVSELIFDKFGPIGDRRFVIVDLTGDFLTQRKFPKMAKIQPRITDEGIELTYLLNPQIPSIMAAFNPQGNESRVRVWADEITGVDCGDDVAHWLSEVLNTPCRLMQLPANNKRCADLKYAPANTGVSYADGFPLLVVSQSSLNALSVQVGDELDVRRFRPNIVVEGAAEAYAERHWTRLTLDDSNMVSQAVLTMVKPCERCVIPTRDLDTLERTPEVIQALKDQCRIDGKTIFGQNAVFNGSVLRQGMLIREVS